MKVMKKEPGKAWEMIEMENTLKNLQEAVGGYIEFVDLAENCTIICNEEGRLLGLPKNRVAGEDFRGTLLLCGTHEDYLVDVPAAAMRMIEEGRL